MQIYEAYHISKGKSYTVKCSLFQFDSKFKKTVFK